MPSSQRESLILVSVSRKPRGFPPGPARLPLVGSYLGGEGGRKGEGLQEKIHRMVPRWVSMCICVCLCVCVCVSVHVLCVCVCVCMCLYF